MTRQPSITQQDLIRLGQIAERNFGLTIGENPWFGGVTAVHVQGSYHYRGLAFDASGSKKQMAAFNSYVAKNYGAVLAELFYDPGVNLKNGAKTNAIGGHSDHVHVAMNPSLLKGHESLFRGPHGGYPHVFTNPTERRRYDKIAAQENLGTGIKDVLPSPGEAASAIGEEVARGMAGLLSSHAEAFMLNVGLVGGGAFLVYYGAALMMGVKSPGKAMAKLAWEGPAGAAGFKAPQMAKSKVTPPAPPKGATP